MFQIASPTLQDGGGAKTDREENRSEGISVGGTCYNAVPVWVREFRNALSAKEMVAVGVARRRGAHLSGLTCMVPQE
jgi:hypothetical protein